MEKIKPAIDAAAVKAKILKDEKGTLVRISAARKLFLWTGLVYFTVALASVGGIGAVGNKPSPLIAQIAFILYPILLLSLAMFTHAVWSHMAYVRHGAKHVPVFTIILAVFFFLLVLPHFGIDALFVKNLTGVEISDTWFQDLFQKIKSFLPL